jgi:group I intron endonuclease
MGVIYLITCKTTGKSYVGQTKHTSRHRWNQHLYEVRHPRVNQSRKLNNAILKYGADDFEIVDLYTNVPDCELDALEQEQIELQGTFGDGYNLTKGGKEQQEVSNDTRERIRQVHKGKVQDGVRKRPEDANLPKYLKHYIGKGGRMEGYKLGHHPKMNGRSLTFTSSEMTMDQKYELAFKALQEVDDGTLVLAPKVDEYGIRKVRHRYEVWNGINHLATFDSFKLTMEEKYQLAKEYAINNKIKGMQFND